jgi:hypothetical protein
MSIHLSLSQNQARFSRQELLKSEINLIEISKKIQNYSKLRKKEILLKTKLKNKFINLQHNLDYLFSLLPKIKTDFHEQELKINSELAEIQEKLKKLTA